MNEPQITDDESDPDQMQLSLPTSGSSEAMSISSPKQESQPPLIVSDIQNISKEIKSLNLLKDHRVCCNVKEKIIIALDKCKDEELFEDNSNNLYIPLAMLKKAVDMFLHLKSSINKQHEYALVLLEENKAKWVLDFTNNIKEILKTLNNINECPTEDVFDLNSLFKEISSRVEIPIMQDDCIPPPYVVRVVLIYNRSYTCPDITFNETVKNIVKSPFFTLDVLMTHQPVDADNNVEKIFSIFQSIDKKGFSYFFSVGRDINALMRAMAKMLGHPLQRPLQKNANYSV